MDYFKKLNHHYRPQKGWVNDPNGLCYFDGSCHVFYQHAPNFEKPWGEPMHWGHARTKDFVEWEELPVALYPDKPYDNGGCWSGTAIVKDGVLYLFYASIYSVFDKDGNEKRTQTISVAYSKDGINFEKYEKNPIISRYPAEGSGDFRDPAVAFVDGKYICVIATGHPESRKGRLVFYESENLFDWTYKGVMAEWDESKYAECPSIVTLEDNKCLVSTSVCQYEGRPYFRIMYGELENGKFKVSVSGAVDKGPDQYAGQMFKDDKGRCLIITWIPGWRYAGYLSKDIGCMSVPREITVRDGKVYGYPVKELQHLLKDSDPAVKMTDNGFVIERTNRDSVVYEGEVKNIKIIRDEFLLEVFVNDGETVYSVLL